LLQDSPPGKVEKQGGIDANEMIFYGKRIPLLASYAPRICISAIKGSHDFCRPSRTIDPVMIPIPRNQFLGYDLLSRRDETEIAQRFIAGKRDIKQQAPVP
jgi:hypothetical protein